MTRPKVAVIGAGPAGSTAARLLAEQGAEIRLFEARRLPRSKTCGGGLTPKAQRLIPASALDVIETWVDRVELRSPHLPSIDIRAPDATIAMVERDRFDLALVEAAARAGAVVRDGEPVRELIDDGVGVVVVTNSSRWRADVAVAADGEPSRVARQLGLGGRSRRLALAIEADVPLGGEPSPDTAILDFGIRGGYGWYFPKRDHANVGVGSYHPARYEGLRDDLVRLAGDLGLDLRQSRVRGHWIPQSLRTEPVASRRVLLAGDAAATADSMFGEGISYAILSGVTAAQAIGDWADGVIPDLRPYDRRLRDVLGPPLGRLHLIARAAELSITAALLAVRVSGLVRERAVDAIAGRRAPFVIDGQCELACACELHASVDPFMSTPRYPARSGHRHCARCSTACAGMAAIREPGIGSRPALRPD